MAELIEQMKQVEEECSQYKKQVRRPGQQVKHQR